MKWIRVTEGIIANQIEYISKGTVIYFIYRAQYLKAAQISMIHDQCVRAGHISQWVPVNRYVTLP